MLTPVSVRLLQFPASARVRSIPGQLSGGGDEKEINELVRRRLAAAGGGSAWESLAGHLEALAVEDSKKAPALQEIAWAGQRVPLRNAKVAGLLAAVVEQQRALAPNASTADALASYDRLLSLCADAVAAAQADIKADEVCAPRSSVGSASTGRI